MNSKMILVIRTFNLSVRLNNKIKRYGIQD